MVPQNERQNESSQEVRVVQIARQYFTQLDLHSSPTLLTDDAQAQQVVALMGLLERRIFSRSTGEGPLPPLEGSQIQSVRQISRLMLDLLETHFGSPPTGPKTLELIGDAHDRFAWGGLAASTTAGIRVPNNVPDSATIFFFPEFAFLALEAGCDAPCWRKLAPVFMRMPAIYLKVFQLRGDVLPKAFDDFGPPPFSSALEPLLRTFAHDLRAQFTTLSIVDLERELGLLAKMAFREGSRFFSSLSRARKLAS